MVASFNEPEHNDVFLTFRIVELDFMCLSLLKLKYRCDPIELHYMYLTRHYSPVATVRPRRRRNIHKLHFVARCIYVYDYHSKQRLFLL